MTRLRAIRALRALRTDILADEQVDWEETERLLAFVHPLSEKYGEDFSRFENLLNKCRADGRITADESEILALQLNLMCSRFAVAQLRLGLIIALGVIVVLAVFAG